MWRVRRAALPCLRHDESVESTRTDVGQKQAVEDLIQDAEHLYEDYLKVAVVADLAQLSQDLPRASSAAYAGPPPVGLVVTGASY